LNFRAVGAKATELGAWSAGAVALRVDADAMLQARLKITAMASDKLPESALGWGL
jgi:hypothetical protein